MTDQSDDSEKICDASSLLTEQHIRIIQSIADLQMALSAMDFMTGIDGEENLTRIVRRSYRCYEDAAVIAYGRAFTQAKGMPGLKMKLLKLKPTGQQKALHERLLDRRQKVVAHSDVDRQRILFKTERLEATNTTVMLPHIDFDDALSFYDDRYHVIEWLRLLIQKASQVLFDHVQNKPPMRFIRDHTLIKGSC